LAFPFKVINTIISFLGLDSVNQLQNLFSPHYELQQKKEKLKEEVNLNHRKGKFQNVFPMDQKLLYPKLPLVTYLDLKYQSDIKYLKVPISMLRQQKI